MRTHYVRTERTEMQIPHGTEQAISVSVCAMLAPLAIPQTNINCALSVFFDELNGKGTRSITEQRPIDRVLTPKQTAEILHRSTKTVCDLAKRGKIRRVCIGADAKRCAGYSEQSVRDFLAGKEAK